MSKVTPSKKGSVKKASGTSETSVGHYNAILLEDIRHKMETVIEATQSTKIELKDEIKALRDDLSGRIDIVEGVLRHHSVGIQKLNHDVAGLKTDVGGLKTDVGGLKSEMRQMEDRLSAKIDRVADRVENHETRIAKLEDQTATT